MKTHTGGGRIESLEALGGVSRGGSQIFICVKLGIFFLEAL